jgi:glutathione-regulated potassium-efflux system ancillary protein KefC
MPNWLILSLIYLAAAVIAVPLARFAGLGSIIGYLVAGIAIGPFGLNLVSDPESMLHFAEFGVVLMLFLVGLELEPRRLWAMRRPIFGWGSFQLLGSAALLFGAAALWGVPGRLALVGALGLAMSSTAIGLAVLNERNLPAPPPDRACCRGAAAGHRGDSILALVSLLALGGAHDDGDPAWIEACVRSA